MAHSVTVEPVKEKFKMSRETKIQVRLWLETLHKHMCAMREQLATAKKSVQDLQ